MRKFIEQDREKVINILVNSFEGNKSVDFVVGKSAVSIPQSLGQEWFEVKYT